LAIVDEAHLISHKDEGGYRNLLNDLREINPALRVIGLTATPYRLGHGLITDPPAIFSDIIEPVKLKDLIDEGYLTPLRSKCMDLLLSVDGVGNAAVIYREALQKKINTAENNSPSIDQTLKIAKGPPRTSFSAPAESRYALRDEYGARRDG
jgi:DNA repair protein RadD